MQMQLQVVIGGNKGKMISVNQDKFLIGRSDSCQLRPKSESISRRHCAIVRKSGKILLIDLKSRNGTEVNGKKLDPSKAKILKDGDHIRVGKLEFTAVIEAGISNVKKSAVKDVKEAAVRTADSSSKFEEVDVSSWLDEPDQINRPNQDTVTRQFHLDENSDMSADATIMEEQAEAETQAEESPKKKGKPGKLPPVPQKPATGNSKDAAQETLRKFFGGGR